MKTTKVENPKEFPTIVKIENDYYVVSNPLDINGIMEIQGGSRLAINLKDGKWFDWSAEHPEFEPQMETFEKGTKFEIEI